MTFTEISEQIAKAAAEAPDNHRIREGVSWCEANIAILGSLLACENSDIPEPNMYFTEENELKIQWTSDRRVLSILINTQKGEAEIFRTDLIADRCEQAETVKLDNPRFWEILQSAPKNFFVNI